MKILKPTNLVYEKDVKNYNKKYYEKYAWIVHLITLKNLISKNSFNGYINLQSNILKNFIGDKFYKGVLNQLLESRILEQNDSYNVGKNSKSYRLSEKYEDSGFESINFDGSKADKYMKKQNGYLLSKINASSNKEVMEKLYKNVKKVKIDYVEANKNIVEQYKIGVIESEHAKSCQNYYINSISTGDVFFTESTKTGRVYHSIGNCNRTIRPYLSYKNEELVQVDIANSQPVFFCPLLIKYVKMMGYFLKYDWKHTAESNNYNINKCNYKPLSYTNYTPYVVSFSSPFPKDVLLYINLTKNGEFYEYLMKEFGIPSSERDSFKTDFFERIFYSKVAGQKRYVYGKKFKVLFPTVYNAILWYKKDEHSLLPIELQKQESAIIIKKVCARIIEENPEELIIPVHDSIACSPSGQDYVYSVMEEELAKGLGFIPTIRKKSF